MEKHAAKPKGTRMPKGLFKGVKFLAKKHGPKAALLTAASTAAIAGVMGYHKLRKKIHYHRGFERMLETHPSLKHEDPTLVRTRYTALFNLAPTLASDPYVAGSVVKQWIEYPVVNTTALKDITRAEADARPTKLFLPALLQAGSALAGG